MAEFERPINIWVDQATFEGLKAVAKRNGRAMCRQGAVFIKACVAQEIDADASAGRSRLDPNAGERRDGTGAAGTSAGRSRLDPNAARGTTGLARARQGRARQKMKFWNDNERPI